VGYFGNFSVAAAEWLKACSAIGIPVSDDFNTIKGTEGAAKISKTMIQFCIPSLIGVQ
jgi:hypothetical protein